MKYLEQTDIVTFENEKEYVVISSILLDDNNFVYLVNEDNPENHMMALVTKEEDRIRIDEIDTSSKDNKELISKLLEEMTIDIYTSIKEDK